MQNEHDDSNEHSKMHNSMTTFETIVQTPYASANTFVSPITTLLLTMVKWVESLMLHVAWSNFIMQLRTNDIQELGGTSRGSNQKIPNRSFFHHQVHQSAFCSHSVHPSAVVKSAFCSHSVVKTEMTLKNIKAPERIQNKCQPIFSKILQLTLLLIVVTTNQSNMVNNTTGIKIESNSVMTTTNKTGDDNNDLTPKSSSHPTRRNNLQPKRWGNKYSTLPPFHPSTRPPVHPPSRPWEAKT